MVAYYGERRQTLDDVVQIFIRMNDGGTPLSPFRPAFVDRGRAMNHTRRPRGDSQTRRRAQPDRTGVLLLDTLLTALRKVIRKDATQGFPAARLGEEMARRGRELVFNDDEVEELADTEYRSPRVFALLSLIFPFVDPGKLFHVDHIFPVPQFSKRRLCKAHVPEQKIEGFRDRANRIGNLQILPDAVNTEKNAAMPAQWLARTYPDEGRRRSHVRDRLLGAVPEEMTGFVEFYDARRPHLISKIKRLLGGEGSG